LAAAVLLGSVYLGKPATMRRVAPAQRHRLGPLVGMILVLVTILRVTHPTTPEEWFVIYALWLIQVGCVFESLAANAGILDVTASLCFVLALLSPFVPFYMPLVAGSLMSLNMASHGLILRGVARRRRRPERCAPPARWKRSTRTCPRTAAFRSGSMCGRRLAGA
jgi:hypothetical protein